MEPEESRGNHVVKQKIIKNTDMTTNNFVISILHVTKYRRKIDINSCDVRRGVVKTNDTA